MEHWKVPSFEYQISGVDLKVTFHAKKQYNYILIVVTARNSFCEVVCRVKNA